MRSALRLLGRSLDRLFRPLSPLGIILKEAWSGMWTHNVARMASSIAYFGIFSLAPLLVIMITAASLVFGQQASEGLIVGQLEETLGEATAAFIQSMLAGIYQAGGLTLATVLAALVLIWAATRIVGAVRGALNDIWGVHGYGGVGLRGFLVGKMVDVAIVIVIGFMFLATMLANAAISAVTAYFSDILPLPSWLLQLIGIAFSLVVITGFLTIIFRALPNVRVRLVYILLGASFTAVLFAIGNYVIGRYLGRTSPGSAFGAAGSLAVIMIWMYFSAYIVLFGAEITRAYAHRGTLRRAKPRRSPLGREASLGQETQLGQGPSPKRDQSADRDEAGRESRPHLAPGELPDDAALRESEATAGLADDDEEDGDYAATVGSLEERSAQVGTTQKPSSGRG